MIHPTRTNLLWLKDRQKAVHKSLAILKARRQALIAEFLSLGEEYLDRHKRLADLYRRALKQLKTVKEIEGETSLDAITVNTPRFKGIDTEEGNILGIPFLTIIPGESLPRNPDQRPYLAQAHHPSLEQSSELFEQLSQAMIEHAGIESRVRRLATAIRETTRVMRTLEDRILPQQQKDIVRIRFFLAERERESHFRLRKFKQLSSSQPPF